MNRLLWVTCAVALLLPSAHGVEWIQPGVNTNKPIWGIRGGLQWAIDSGGFNDRTGPRGLIRVGYPVLSDGRYDLVNFIAIEPVVNGQKGFSELEQSELDSRQGKRLWAFNPDETGKTNLVAGSIAQLSPGVEELKVVIHVEPFQNGANVRLTVSQRSDLPDEIRMRVNTKQDSASLEYCILTATMGNMARARNLWLKDRTVSSLKLYPDHDRDDFAPHTFFPLDQLLRTKEGHVLTAITTDETEPHKIFPFPGTRRWYYGGTPVTQYWKKERNHFRDDLHVAVNARYTYWKSQRPIPGGVSYENFEMRETFHEGQEFIFGITRKRPAAFGFNGD